jgi:hypothetical protein
MFRFALMIILVSGLSGTVCAQTAASPSAVAEAQTANTWRLLKGAPKPVANIDTAAWLVGQYGGTGLGGDVEYQWLPPHAGQMYGTFRLIQNGKTTFSEILQLTEVDGTLALRVKHFTNDFVGWEEKDKFFEFRLVDARADELRFDGLTLRRTADGVRGFIAIRSRPAGADKETPATLRESEMVFTRLPR